MATYRLASRNLPCSVASIAARVGQHSFFGGFSFGR